MSNRTTNLCLIVKFFI